MKFKFKKRNCRTGRIIRALKLYSNVKKLYFSYSIMSTWESQVYFVNSKNIFLQFEANLRLKLKTKEEVLKFEIKNPQKRPQYQVTKDGFPPLTNGQQSGMGIDKNISKNFRNIFSKSFNPNRSAWKKSANLTR